MPLFHVSSVRNRASITTHGLDWSRMAAAPGIAGSTGPEVEGVFLARSEFDVDWFVRMNNTGGGVDVWAVAGVDERELRTGGNGYDYLPAVIAPEQLTLVERDAVRATLSPSDDSDAYGSRLTITWDEPD